MGALSPGKGGGGYSRFINNVIEFQSKKYYKIMIRVELSPHDQIMTHYREEMEGERHEACDGSLDAQFEPVIDGTPPSLEIDHYLLGIALASKLASMDFTIVYFGKHWSFSRWDYDIDYVISLEDASKGSRINIAHVSEHSYDEPDNITFLEIEVISESERYATLIEKTIRDLIAEIVVGYAKLVIKKENTCNSIS